MVNAGCDVGRKGTLFHDADVVDTRVALFFISLSCIAFQLPICLTGMHAQTNI